MEGRSAAAASGADSTEEVQTLSIRLPNGELRSCQVPSGTPIESITEIFEKEIPPYHEAKLCVRDEILCGGIVADGLEGEVTLVKMPSIKKAFVVLQRLHSEAPGGGSQVFDTRSIPRIATGLGLHRPVRGLP